MGGATYLWTREGSISVINTSTVSNTRTCIVGIIVACFSLRSEQETLTLGAQSLELGFAAYNGDSQASNIQRSRTKYPLFGQLVAFFTSIS